MIPTTTEEIEKQLPEVHEEVIRSVRKGGYRSEDTRLLRAYEITLQRKLADYTAWDSVSHS